MRMLRTGLVPWNGNADEVCVIVTVPAFHAPVHYEVDRALGVLRVTRVLRREPRLVHNCGCIPRTLVGDARPLEVAVFAPWPLEQLSLVVARPVGMFSISQESVTEPRIIAMPADSVCSTTSSVRSADDIGPAMLSRLMQFFTGCSDSPRSADLCIEWGDVHRAEDVMCRAACAFNEHGQCRR